MVLLRAVCVLLSLCYVLGKEYVQEFTDDDFSSRISSAETVLVMFYAPW